MEKAKDFAEREAGSQESYRKELQEGVKFGRQIALESEKLSRESKE
jgi:hypothetical protein